MATTAWVKTDAREPRGREVVAFASRVRTVALRQTALETDYIAFVHPEHGWCDLQDGFLDQEEAHTRARSLFPNAKVTGRRK